MPGTHTKRSDRRIVEIANNPHNFVSRKELAGRLVRGSLSFEEAIDQLGDRNPGSVFTAGLLAVEAAGLTSGDQITEYLGYAAGQFSRVIKLGELGLYPSVRPVAQAKVQSAYLPARALMLGEGRLPTAEMARKTHDHTVSTLSGLLDFYRRNEHLRTQRSRAKGTISELLVLGLLQRFAIANGLTESYYPFLSDLTNDEHPSSSQVMQAWDISLFTDTGDESGIGLTYPIQVKSSAPPIEKRLQYTGQVIPIFLNMDLPRFTQRSVLIEEAADDLIVDQSGAGADIWVANRNNVRTEVILDLLDKRKTNF